MIRCKSIHGNFVEIPKEKFVFRPSAYGVILHEGKILMIKNKTNGKFFFPGGGINIGERIPDAIKREVKMVVLKTKKRKNRDG
ncbi:MAG: NUDIX domain-containing protein [bacterium]|nr:NUDIX domain-containing protein [bacterium]